MNRITRTGACFQVCALLLCAAAYADAGEPGSGFEDVPASAWYAEAMDWVV